MKNTKNKISVGIIGIGGFGLFTIQNIKNTKNLDLSAISSRDAQKCEKLKSDYQIRKSYTNYEDLLKDKEIDSVIISTPPYLHYEMTKAALINNKNVLVEKPAMLRVDEFDEILALSKEKNLLVALDYIQRFNPVYDILRNIIEKKVFGQMTQFTFTNLASDSGLPSDHWFWKKELSGGIFIEHGVHFFDIYESLLGRPKILFANTYSRKNGIEDRVNCILEYPDQIKGTFFHSFDKPSVLESTFSTIVFDNAILKINGWIADSIDCSAVIEQSQLQEVEKTGLEIKKTKSLNYSKGKGYEFKNPIYGEFIFKNKKNKSETYREHQIQLLEDFAGSILNHGKCRTELSTTKGSLLTAIECAGKR